MFSIDVHNYNYRVFINYSTVCQRLLYKIHMYVPSHICFATVVHALSTLHLVCICFSLPNHVPLCPGEATATGGDITLKTVKDATWDARAQWYHLAINLDVDSGTRDVSILSKLPL